MKDNRITDINSVAYLEQQKSDVINFINQIGYVPEWQRIATRMITEIKAPKISCSTCKHAHTPPFIHPDERICYNVESPLAHCNITPQQSVKLSCVHHSDYDIAKVGE